MKMNREQCLSKRQGTEHTTIPTPTDKESIMALTPEQIVSAVDTLKQRGQAPTLRAIRDLLGTGSLGTISRILRELKEKTPPGGASGSLPSGLLQALEEAFAGHERDLRSALERDRQEDRRQIETLEEDNLRLESRIGALEQNGRLLTEELQKGEGRIAEIRRHCESLERSLEREREERIRAEKQASVLEGERNGLLGQLADLRERLETAPLRSPGKKKTPPPPDDAGGQPSRKRIRRLT